jgi:hypothetical protein
MEKKYKNMFTLYTELGIGAYNSKVMKEIQEKGIADILSRYKVKVLKDVFGEGYEGDNIEKDVNKAYNSGIAEFVEIYEAYLAQTGQPD